jgi:hypothetical protein
MRMRRAAAAAVSGIIVLGAAILSPSPAHAATGWNLTGTAGDRVGAWAYGSFWWGSDGRLHVSVNVKDTAANSKDARVKLRAFYLNGDTRNETVINNGGAGSVLSREFTFRSDVIGISGRECIDNSTTSEQCGPGWGEVY